jgi:hypothetical protein
MQSAQAVEKFPTEPLRQSPDRKQGSLGSRYPSVASLGELANGHHAVQMRVQAQIPCPGVWYRSNSQLCIQLPTAEF